MARYGNNYGVIAGWIVGIILTVCLVVLAIIGIKAAVDDVSFSESWDTFWGVETSQELDPDATDNEQIETPVVDDDETVDDTEQTDTEQTVDDNETNSQT